MSQSGSLIVYFVAEMFTGIDHDCIKSYKEMVRLVFHCLVYLLDRNNSSDFQAYCTSCLRHFGIESFD